MLSVPPLTPPILLHPAHPDRTSEWKLARSGTVIGRGKVTEQYPPDVSLADTHAALIGTVSRRHARFTFDGRNYLIEDLASLNGSRVNGRQLQPFQPYRLVDGDRIELAGLRFLFIRRSGDAVIQLVA